MNDRPLPPNAPQQFTKKPVTIWALKFDGTLEAGKTVEKFVCRELAMGATGGDPLSWHVYIPTLEGLMKASAGDWIIKGVADELYPCKPDIFEKTYAAPLPPPQARTPLTFYDFWIEYLKDYSHRNKEFPLSKWELARVRDAAESAWKARGAESAPQEAGALERNTLAKAIWESEIAEENLRGDKKDWAQWPEDFENQPYCRSTLRQADFIINKLAERGVPLEETKNG